MQIASGTQDTNTMVHVLTTKLLKMLKTIQYFIWCVGRSKANQGWTPIHLAAYFGHKNVVKALLEVSQT